jgi:hypothetical protein
MGGQAVRRLGGQAARRTALCAAAVLLTGYPPNRLSAQVGYPPAASPYRDIPRGPVAIFGIGYLGGSRGRVGVGMADGITWNARYETGLGGAVTVGLGLAYAQTTRYTVDPTRDAATRTQGPIETDVILADLGLQLVLTGRKSWHGVAPYLGAGVGLAFGGSPQRDPGGYEFRTKITLNPQAGVRWHPSARLSVRAAVQAVYWRLNYPLSYKDPSPVDGSRVLPLEASLTEWTAHPWISVGVGWNF